jgi:hypothetical protein
MPTVQHSALTAANLHEPKGADTAAVNKVYVSDGAGSGAWKTICSIGWEDISHNGAAQNLSSGVRTKLLNDQAGSQSDTTYILPSASSVWDSTNNQFDFAAAGLLVGDTVDLRIDMEYTVDTNNGGFLVEMDFAVGGSFPFTLPVDERNIDQAGSQQVQRYISVYIGSSDVLNNPAELYITANSANDSVDVNGFFVRMAPVNPRYS